MYGWLCIQSQTQRKVINKTINLTLGMNGVGRKELLVNWWAETKNAALWVGLLSDFKVKSVEDILINFKDNFNGFTQCVETKLERAYSIL